MRKIKSILTAGSIAGVIFAMIAAVNITNVPQRSAAAASATPTATATATAASKTTATPGTTATASTSASPNPSATASATATPSASPTGEPAMSVMNAPVEQKITKKGLIYEYTATYAHLIGCTNSAKQKKSINVPAKICVQDLYYDVTMIDYEAFKGCKKLKNITIGRYVKQIRYGAFMGDSKLKRVTFQGKKLKNVGDDAFYKTASGIRFVMPKAVKTKYQKLLKDGNPRRAVYQGK